jgi:hypothetical protein
MDEPLSMTVDTRALVDLRTRAEGGDRLRRELAKRVGVPVDAPLDVLVAGLAEALSEAADTTLPGDRDGLALVEKDALARLRADAELGRGWRHRELLNDAMRAGKFPPAMRASWATLLEVDPGRAEAELAKLRPNTVPVAELGHGGEPEPNWWTEHP